jgi:hypothetical protein
MIESISGNYGFTSQTVKKASNISKSSAIKKDRFVSTVASGAPNWNVIPSKADTDKTEEQFVSEIKSLAQRAASAGSDNELAAVKSQVLSLHAEYLSRVSPDRKQMYEELSEKPGNSNKQEYEKPIGELTIMDYLIAADTDKPASEYVLSGGATVEIGTQTGVGNTISVKSEGANVLMYTAGQWSYGMTSAEQILSKQFYNIYNTAYKEAKSESVSMNTLA